VNPSEDHVPHSTRTSIHMDAGLDTVMRATADELAERFHQPRLAAVCSLRRWGLSRRSTENFDGGAAECPSRPLFLDVDTELRAQVEEAVIAAGMKTAP
jgi:hypothetical protein